MSVASVLVALAGAVAVAAVAWGLIAGLLARDDRRLAEQRQALKDYLSVAGETVEDGLSPYIANPRSRAIVDEACEALARDGAMAERLGDWRA